MGSNSKIEWTDHTFNPVVGCTKVSAACDFCYAESWAKRTGQSELWTGTRRRTSASNWRQPLKWNAECEAGGIRARVFCASLADVFDNQWETQWRVDLFDLIWQTPALDWLLLTKRPQNIAKMLPAAISVAPGNWPWPNVWLGTTVENQEETDRRIPQLLAVPARVHFLSCEPLLGPIDLMTTFLMTRANDALRNRQHEIDWVIGGGESGPQARPPHPDWFRSARNACAQYNVPFFFKQWGEYGPTQRFGDKRSCAINIDGKLPPWDGTAEGIDGVLEALKAGRYTFMSHYGKHAAGRLLDGREHSEFPPSLLPLREKDAAPPVAQQPATGAAG